MLIDPHCLIPDVDRQLAAHFRMPEGEVYALLTDDAETTDEKQAEQTRLRAKRAAQRARDGADADRYDAATREARKRDLEARRAMARKMGISLDALRKRLERGTVER